METGTRKRHHEKIRFHLMIRVDRMVERLGHQPLFLPVGAQEIIDFAQWQIDKKLVVQGHPDYCETVISSFNGILPPLTVWSICGVTMKQV